MCCNISWWNCKIRHVPITKAGLYTTTVTEMPCMCCKLLLIEFNQIITVVRFYSISKICRGIKTLDFNSVLCIYFTQLALFLSVDPLCRGHNFKHISLVYTTMWWYIHMHQFQQNQFVAKHFGNQQTFFHFLKQQIHLLEVSFEKNILQGL